MLQLKYSALALSADKDKSATSEMLNVELIFAADYLLFWFNRKIKSKNLIIDAKAKTKYEVMHPVNWSKDTCCICNFPLHINSN